MERDSLYFHQSHAVDEEAKANLKYQTLLNEYLKLQKEFVSKKRKLAAAKRKRDKIFAEVRFLRRRHKYLYRIKASNKGKDDRHLPSLDKEINALEGERTCSAYEAAAAGNSDEILISKSHIKSEEDGGQHQVLGNELRFAKRPKNDLITDKAKRKISQHDQFTLHV